MTNQSPGIDEILQTMSGNVVISIFAIVYYLISWMILIGSWAEKQYNGMQTGHMNMFFSLIFTSYGLLYVQGKSGTLNMKHLVVHGLVFLDVICTGFIALTTSYESLNIYCNHAVDKKRRTKEPKSNDFYKEKKKRNKNNDPVYIEYTKIKDPLSNLNEPTAALYFSLILARLCAGICLTVCAIYYFDRNKTLQIKLLGRPIPIPEGFLFAYFVMIIVSFILYGEIKKMAKKTRLTTEELRKCESILNKEGVDTTNLIGEKIGKSGDPKTYIMK
tara:strand:- start:10137 stop:10958 length:822 start_codon:yes stop_codon:yes gene_type:complete